MKIAAAKDMKLVKENMISYVDDHGDLREATEHVYKIEVALAMSDGSEHNAHVYTIKFSDPGAASAFNQFPVDSIENLNRATPPYNLLPRREKASVIYYKYQGRASQNERHHHVRGITMPTCYCNECKDKRHTNVHLTTNTNTNIRTTYSKLIDEGTVIRIDGQGFYYSNANPFYDRLDGVWVGDKGNTISAKEFLNHLLQGDPELVYSHSLSPTINTETGPQQ